MVGLNGIVIKSHGGADIFGFQRAIEVAILEARDGVPARIAEQLGLPTRPEGFTMYARIAGTGSYLPEKILTNADLEKIVDTTDEWIRTRTGIEQRHVVVDGETTADLAEQAARRAMADAGVEPDEVDLICVGTTTPDFMFPNVGTCCRTAWASTAVRHSASRRRAPGFSMRLSVADKFVRLGEAKCALVIGAETLTRIVDWKDRAPACCSPTAPAP
jgi:3-oxoacyl-[acyl-carrier-protein] synthase III